MYKSLFLEKTYGWHKLEHFLREGLLLAYLYVDEDERLFLKTQMSVFFSEADKFQDHNCHKE